MKPVTLRPRQRRIRALTPVIATVLMIAVTLVVAFAAWAWARSATSSSENVFNSSTGQNINQLKERLAIPNANFSSVQKNKVTIWLYNDGNITTSVIQVWISNSSYTWTQTSSPLPLSIPQGQISSLTITASSTSQFTIGGLYTIKVLATYGNTFTYVVVR